MAQRSLLQVIYRLSTFHIVTESTNTPRIRGLDGLRFICALLVVSQHVGGVPLLQDVGYGTAFGKVAHGIYDIFSCGFAAVIVFFVISGFCIHFPYREGQPILKWQFWVRRYIRVLPPLLLAIGFAYAVGANMSLLAVSVTWSVLAELIYYALYPVLLRLSKIWNWNKLLAGSLILSALVIGIHSSIYPSQQLYAIFGPWLNWVVGLPCWLLGCKLAHHWHRERTAVSSTGIWFWRAGVFAACWLSNFFMIHGWIGLPWSLNAFAFVVFFWLREEIAFYQKRPESAILVWAGGWSYSLYLTHVPSRALLNKILPSATDFSWFRWSGTLLFILAIAWIFYWSVERYYHRLARKIPIRPFGLDPYFSRSEMLRLDDKYLASRGWQGGRFVDLMNQLFRLYVQAPEHPGKMRLEHWWASRIFPSEGVPFRIKGGVHLLLHPKDWIEYLLIKKEEHQPVTLDFLRANLQEGNMAFFAGVSFGLQLVVAAQKVGSSGKIIGIEPQPGSLARTMENLRLNGLNGQVILVAGALGEERGMLPMEEAPVEDRGAASLRNSGQHSRLLVFTQPVQEIAGTFSCFNPRILLIGVEGFEAMVLKGFGDKFRPDLLIIEINRENSLFSVAAETSLIQIILDLGYQLYDLAGRPVKVGSELIENNAVAVRHGMNLPVWPGNK